MLPATLDLGLLKMSLPVLLFISSAVLLHEVLAPLTLVLMERSQVLGLRLSAVEASRLGRGPYPPAGSES